MSNWNHRLKIAFDESSYNKSQFAKAVGVSAPTVTDWMSGEIKNLSADNAHKVCSVLGITSAWLLKGKGPMRPEAREQSPGYLDGNLEFNIPLISWVSAGRWCESPDNYSVGDAEEWLPRPKGAGQRTFALWVRGDSMTSPYPGQRSYPDGTIIYVDPERPVSSGARVIGRANGEYTFKVYVEDAGRKYLKPINPTYDKIDVTDDPNICGVIIGSYLPE